MYCVKCGVKLADSEKECPLCRTPVYHPDLKQPDGEKLYPPFENQIESVNPSGVLFIITMLFAIPAFVVLLSDIQLNSGITWSGYAAGALFLAYIFMVLPFWFKKPNPVIFVPVDFASVGLFLFYIDFTTGGNWFFPFALPIVGSIAAVITAVIALLRYVRRGQLYIFGGASIATGILCVMLEILINVTFCVRTAIIWSVFPLFIFFIIGITLIVIAICKPLRESLRKKFFL